MLLGNKTAKSATLLVRHMMPHRRKKCTCVDATFLTQCITQLVKNVIEQIDVGKPLDRCFRCHIAGPVS